MRRLLAALLVSTTAIAESPVDIDADELTAAGLDTPGGLTTLSARGHVRFRRGTLDIRAPSLDYDAAAHTASLSGGIVGRQGSLLFSARSVQAALDARKVDLTSARLVVADAIDEARVTAALASGDGAALERAGRTTLTMTGTTLDAADPDHLGFEGAWLSTCDCTEGRTPFIALSAERVDVTPGDLAQLSWWKLRVFDVPVTPPLPSLSFPLRPRASGLLFPRWGLNGPAGFSVELPIFVTLGDSADVTISPRWMRGGPLLASGGEGVRGVGLSTEWRWVPAEGAAGSLVVAHAWDWAHPTAPLGGNRLDLRLSHAQPLGSGRAVVNAEVLSDGAVLLDTEADPSRAQLPYARSTLGWSAPITSGSVAVASRALQVLTPARVVPGAAPSAESPVLRVESGHAMGFGAGMVDAGVTALFESRTFGANAGVSRAIGGASLVATLPLLASNALVVDAESSLRGDAVVGDSLAFRAAGFAGVRAATRIERRFGDGWRHDIAFSVHARAAAVLSGVYAPLVLRTGADGEVSRSDLDAVVSKVPSLQAIAAIRMSLGNAQGAENVLSLEHHPAVSTAGGVDAGQVHGRLRVMLGVKSGAPSIDGSAVYDLVTKRLSFGSIRASAQAGKLGLSGGYAVFEGAASDLLGRPLDLLFLPRELLPVASASPRVTLIDAAVSLPIASDTNLRFGGGYTQSGTAEATSSGSMGLSWTAGGCATVGLAAIVVPRAGVSPWDALQIGFTFELGDVASQASAALQRAGN